MKNPNRLGTCYKLQGKRRKPYIARAYTGKNEDGKPNYKTIGYFKTKTEGIQSLIEYKTNPYDIDNTKLTLADVFEKFKEEHKNYVQKRTFFNNYELAFEKLKPLHNEIFINLRPLQYQKIINENANKYKKTYLKKIKTLLGLLYDFAEMKDIIKTDYSKGIRIIGQETGEQDEFTIFEVAKMVKNIEKIENLDMIVIMCLTGIRPQELLNISIFNLDFQKNIIHSIGVKTTAGKRKRIPISPIIKPYLLKRCKESENYLFLNKKQNQMDYHYFLYNVYKPCLKSINLKYKSPKACRHFWATVTKEKKVDGKVRTNVLGHTNEEFTNTIYTHLQDEFNKKECKKIDDYIYETLKNL